LSEEVKLLIGKLHKDVVYKIEEKDDRLKSCEITELPKNIYEEIQSTQNLTKITLDKNLDFEPFDKEHIDSINNNKYEELLTFIENKIEDKYKIK